MVRAVRARLAPDESGITMIELIISSILALIVLGLVGTFLIQSFTVQDRIQVSNSATGAGQLVTESLTTGIRTSTSVAWTSSSSGELLVARTNNSAGTVSCGYEAWYFALAGTGAIYTKRSTAAITAPTTSAQLATWQPLAEGVSRSGSTFVFPATGLQVDVRFNVKVRSEAAVPFKTTIISRGTTLESYQCS